MLVRVQALSLVAVRNNHIPIAKKRRTQGKRPELLRTELLRTSRFPSQNREYIKGEYVLRLRANVLTMEHARAKRRRQADAALQHGSPTGAFDGTVHTSELEGDASDMEDDGRAIVAVNEAREELGEETMDELNKLRSSTRRFDLQLKAISVHQMEQWYHTNLVMGTKLTVPEHYYQRNAASGWSHDQKAEYLRTVFAGQAGTLPIQPLPVNAEDLY